MKLILNTLTITNFKGITFLEINPDSKETNIFAANERGKTTISDAWHWLLTGKNSANQKDFNIKNTVNTELNRSDHEVVAHLTIDGSSVTLKKIYKEKWNKKRGSEQAEFTGNETLYYCNDVPLQQGEYQSKVNGFLNESVLKMVTNPLFFNTNTANWSWQKRREVLLAIAGKISDHDIFDAITTKSNASGIHNLQMILNSGKTLAEYKREIAARKKKLKDDLAGVPIRINEATRSMPELVDYSSIQLQIDAKNTEIAELDQALSDKNKALELEHLAIQQRQTKIHELTTRQSAISFEIRTEITNAGNDVAVNKNRFLTEISGFNNEIQSQQRVIDNSTSKKTEAEAQIKTLRERWQLENSKEIVFDQHAFECPTCRRAYETDDIEEMQSKMVTNFNAEKERKLTAIINTAKSLGKQVEEFDVYITEAQAKIDTATSGLTDAKSRLAAFDNANILRNPSVILDERLADNDEYIQLMTEISELKAKNAISTPVDNSEINTRKREITAAIDDLKKQLATKEVIDRLKKRIEELKTEEKSLSQQFANLEKTEFLMDDYNRSKMDIMEARINGKFKYVTFKLFDRQVNGGVDETCETMYKGVPFSDLNTAGKIWAGIDIINTLSDHYSVSAPIFLDNRESVTQIPDTKSQIINLVVSADDTVIRVEPVSEHLQVA